MADDNDIARTTAAFASITRDLEALNRRAKEAVSPTGGIGQLDNVFGRITSTLLGTAGVAAGLYQVGRSLETVAQSSVQLQMFARNVNLSTDSVSSLQQGMRRLGMSTSEADGMISSITGKLNNLRAFKEGSEIYQTLTGVQGGAAVVRELQGLVETGKQMEAVTKIFEIFQAQTERGKIAWASYWNVSVAAMEKGPNAIKRNIEALKVNREEAEKYHNMWIDFEVRFEGIWKRIASHGIEGINALSEALKSQGISAKSIADAVNADTDSTLAKLRATIEEYKKLKQAFNDMSGDDPAKGKEGARSVASNFLPGLLFSPEGGQPFGSWADSLNLTPEELWSGKRFEKKDQPKFTPDRYNGRGSQPLGGRSKNDKRSDQRSEGTSGATDFSGMRRSDSVEEESNDSLRDIRDILKRMEDKTGNHGGPTYGEGVRGNGELAAGLGGFRPFKDSASTGDVSSGASTGGAIGRAMRGGGGAAGPAIGDLSGLKGSDFLAKQRASRIAEINSDPELKENVLKMLQLEEGSTTGKTGAMEALLNRSIMTGNSVKSELFSGFYGPINRGGLRKPLPGAARKTSESAFDNAAGGSNIIDGRTDQGMAGDPNANGPGRIKVPGTSGIFNFWKGKRGGKYFSHEDSARFAAEQRRQIEGGGDASGSPASTGSTFGRHMDDVEAARQRMDRANGDRAFNGKLDAEVRFLNVPPGVQTKVDSEGDIFHKLQVNKSRQGEVAGGSPGQPYAGVW